MIEYEVSRDYITSILPRIVDLLKYFSPDLLPLSNSVGVLLQNIRETITKVQYNDLGDIIEGLFNAFTERQNRRNSLQGRYAI